MDETKVTPRFVGDDVNLQHISSLLQLKPDRSEAKGMPVENHSNRRYPTNYWGIDSPLSEHASIAEHIEYLLALLEPHREAMPELMRDGYEPNFYCGLFYTRYSGYVTFGPNVLKRVGQLGASLDIHVYHSRHEGPITE